MGTHFAGNKEELRALNTYIKLVRAADSVMSRVYRNSNLNGLTISQFGVLEALLHLGPLCQRELGTKILKSSGNITMVIDNLEKRELVERKRDRRDRRFVNVHLTGQGRKMIRKIFPRHVASIRAELEILSPGELTQFGDICRRVGLGKESG